MLHGTSPSGILSRRPGPPVILLLLGGVAPLAASGLLKVAGPQSTATSIIIDLIYNISFGHIPQ